eukprot:SM007689S21884  [mRNA]  locus=s7689:61:420:- [translate_table: standard]
MAAAAWPSGFPLAPAAEEAIALLVASSLPHRRSAASGSSWVSGSLSPGSLPPLMDSHSAQRPGPGTGAAPGARGASMADLAMDIDLDELELQFPQAVAAPLPQSPSTSFPSNSSADLLR